MNSMIELPDLVDRVRRWAEELGRRNIGNANSQVAHVRHVANCAMCKRSLPIQISKVASWVVEQSRREQGMFDPLVGPGQGIVVHWWMTYAIDSWPIKQSTWEMGPGNTPRLVCRNSEECDIRQVTEALSR